MYGRINKIRTQTKHKRKPILFYIFSFEAKRLEIEKWLQRMESRLEQMGKIATTVDVLEAQQKEQKVNHPIRIDSLVEKFMRVSFMFAVIPRGITPIQISC